MTTSSITIPAFLTGDKNEVLYDCDNVGMKERAARPEKVSFTIPDGASFRMKCKTDSKGTEEELYQAVGELNRERQAHWIDMSVFITFIVLLFVAVVILSVYTHKYKTMLKI